MKLYEIKLKYMFFNWTQLSCFLIWINVYYLSDLHCLEMFHFSHDFITFDLFTCSTNIHGKTEWDYLNIYS
jgi:hypothetical protein